MNKGCSETLRQGKHAHVTLFTPYLSHYLLKMKQLLCALMTFVSYRTV